MAWVPLRPGRHDLPPPPLFAQAEADNYFAWMEKRALSGRAVSLPMKGWWGTAWARERKSKKKKIKSKPFAFHASEGSKEDKEQSSLWCPVLSGN